MVVSKLAKSKLILVLASYNGARFIEDQIRSIQGQTFKDWTLLIRDDGSSDDTVDRIRSLAQTDNRITLLIDELGNLGVTQNFARLMQAALDGGADYVAMSDQDDVWHREKLKILLDEMQKIESSNTTTIPILVHSDLEVVDRVMCTINTSFMDYAGISPAPPRLEHLLCQNIVTGCACLINRTLLKLALPVSREVPLHDWWLALLALSCGVIGYVEQTLVRYRQHEKNVVGVKYDLARTVRHLLKPVHWQQQVNAVRSSILQAGLLIERLQVSGAILHGSNRLDVVVKYAKLENIPRLQRWKVLTAHKINKRSRISNFIFELIVLSLPLSSIYRGQ
jgi:glycosyltransferase involved in cell wall biosynthesis